MFGWREVGTGAWDHFVIYHPEFGMSVILKASQMQTLIRPGVIKVYIFT